MHSITSGAGNKNINLKFNLMYYSKIETLSNCVYVRKDLENGKTLIYARVFFHDYDNDTDSIDFAEHIVKLLNT